MSDKLHHPFSPSKLEFLENCPNYESVNSVSEKARLGTLQHAVAETGQDDLSLSDEEAAAAIECIEFFEKKKQVWELEGPVTELSEMYFPVDDETVEGFQGTTGGYLDKALINHSGDKAVIFDWKYGQWKVTEASENLQAAAYALGIFKAYPKVTHIDFYFKQPHIDFISHVAWARTDVPALYLRILRVVNRARHARASGNFGLASPTIPGCLFCAQIGICPKVAEFACKAGSKFHPLEIPENITPTMIQTSRDTTLGLRLASVMAVWAEAFRRQTTDRVLRGDADIPAGFKVESKSKRDIVDAGKFKSTSLKFVTESEYVALQDPPGFGKIEDMIKEKAPRGQKKAALEDFKNALESDGAVVKSPSYSYLKAVPKDVGSQQNKNTQTES